jgi:TIGR03009 family protein
MGRLSTHPELESGEVPMKLGVTFLTLTTGLLGFASVLAQPPATPGAAPASDQRLDELLRYWEQDAARMQMMVAEFKCTRKNKTFNKTETYTGSLKFMRPEFARFEMSSVENPQTNYERFICTGSHLYVFRPAESTLIAYPLPARAAGQSGQLPDDGPLPFISGMKADTAKKRYQIKITKEDQYYIYVDVLPNYPRDQQDFTYARLVILRSTMLPRQLFWVDPQNIEVTWDITRVLKDREAEGAVKREDFMKPEVPRGWQLKVSEGAAAAGANPNGTQVKFGQPRVIRPQQ